MYKIMLVEDETAVLHAMTDTLDWNALSFHAPVACADGQAAIDAVEAGFVPDAVITDICMPFVGGVALTEYLSQHCPQTLVVLLTGYDDFSYAQKAIKLKVYDYVLKPITPKSLRQLAARLCDELENRRIKNTDSFDALTRERFFVNVLTAHLDEKTVLDNFRVHKIEPSGAYWRVLVADLDLPAAVTAAESRDNELLHYGLGNIVTELAQAVPGAVACVPVNDTYCVVLNGATPNALCETARAFALQIAQACKMIGKATTCGVGNAVESPQVLHDSYSQAVLALHYRFFYGHVPCILNDEIDVQPTAQFDYATYENQFTVALKQVNRAQTHATVDALFAQMQTQRLPYALCLRYCQRTVLQLFDRMSEYLSAEEMDRLRHAWDNANFFSATTLAQLHDMLLQICELSFDSFSRMNEDDATVRVHKAETYIREHYGEDSLSLNTIRDAFSISVSYFSAIFKAGTGYTFVEYLTQVRIEKAKELLTLTEKRTGEIAAEVGFADPHYFSVTFKRVTGLTPREYRTQQHCVC